MTKDPDPGGSGRLPARPRLESKLDGALAHRLTVLVGDAGFGKTTLLATWSAGINAVVHPLTVEDRDLTQLWRRLVDALRRHLTDLPELREASTEAVRGPVSAHSDQVRPQAMAELLGHALAQRLTRDLVLVLDDAHLVTDGPAASFAAGLVRHAPPLLHVVLATRGPLPVPVRRLREQGGLLEVTGAELAFTTGEVAALLSEVVGTGAAGLAAQVRRATGGWPMAVRLAAEALRDVDPTDRAAQLAGLAGGGQLTALIRTAYAQEPAAAQRLLSVGALLERFTVGLCEALGIADAGDLVAGMVRRGLFLEPAAPPSATDTASDRPRPAVGEWYRLHPLASRFIHEYTVMPPAEAAGLHAAAARWFAGRGMPEAALRSALAAGDRDRVAALLGETGEQLASAGRTGVVLDAIDALSGADATLRDRNGLQTHSGGRSVHTRGPGVPSRSGGDGPGGNGVRGRSVDARGPGLQSRGGGDGPGGRLVRGRSVDAPGRGVQSRGGGDGLGGAVGVRDADIERLAGHAYLMRGEWDEALACYTRAAGDRDPLPPGLAWRMGMIYYLRGEYDRALATYQRAADGGPPSRDTAMVLAWAAAAHWIRGDPKTCGELAAQAFGVATEVDDPAALATAHTVLSMLAALEGDRRANAAHYGRALEYAQQAGDVLQLIRIHTNRCSHSLEEGAYADAMAELEVAIRLADLYGYGGFGGVALTNRAQIRLRLGQLEEAHRDIETALSTFDQLGSRKAAYPLTRLGELHHLRGEHAAAVRAYEQALAHTERSGDQQAAVVALAGLARVLAESDPDRAASLAEQAVACGEGIGYVEALLAAARVALARGGDSTDPASTAEPGGVQGARHWLDTAATVAAARRDRAGMAEADELAAAASGDDARARALARRSAARWAEIEDPIGQARAELVLAGRLDDAAARATAEAVRLRMRGTGCRLLAAQADALLDRIAAPPSPPIRVETLGTFRVLRAGAPLPASAWRSRKAREVLKILVARRGRPVTRDYLMETLWPGEDAEPLPNRLHVALSTLRSVLDPDRRFDGDAFVATEGDAVRVRLEQVSVDVEEFLADAEAGLGSLRAGATAEAVPRLVRAESRYGGDFLEEDLYGDWSAPLREQARATYLEVAAALADHASETGDTDAATRYLLRMLEHDPYDERAHLRLVSTFVASGRHGDARRHYRHYCARMDELDIEAAPFPAS